MEEKRILSDKEVDMLFDFSLSIQSKFNIFIGSCDDELVSQIQNVFSEDSQVTIKNVRFGCDTLLECERYLPDVVILDEELPDIPSVEVIRCLKRREELKEITVICSLNTDKTDLVADWGADDYFVKYNLDKIYLLRKEYKEINSSNNPVSQIHGRYCERRWPRAKLNIEAKFEIIDMIDPGQKHFGKAIMENISRGGAYISKIKLENEKIFDGTFKIRLNVDQPFLKNWKADAIFISEITSDSAGIKFINISKNDQLKIANLFND